MARKNKNKKNKNKKSAKERFHEQISSSFENSQEALAESVIESKPEDKTVETNIDKTKDTTAEVATKNTTDSKAKEVVKDTSDKTTQAENQQQENSDKKESLKKDKQSKNKKEKNASKNEVHLSEEIKSSSTADIKTPESKVDASTKVEFPNVNNSAEETILKTESSFHNNSTGKEIVSYQDPNKGRVNGRKVGRVPEGAKWRVKQAIFIGQDTRTDSQKIVDTAKQDLHDVRLRAENIKNNVLSAADKVKDKASAAANAAKETGKKAVNATDKFLSKSPDLVKINKSSPDIFGGKFRLTKAGALGAVVAGSLFAIKDFGESYYREPASAGSATPLISSPVINAVQSSSSGLTPKNAMDNMGASGDLNFALRERNRLAPGQL